jgi:hypothetical protein
MAAIGGEKLAFSFMQIGVHVHANMQLVGKTRDRSTATYFNE